MAKFVLIFSGLKLGVCLAKTQRDILGLVKHIFRFSCFKVQLSYTVVIALKYIAFRLNYAALISSECDRLLRISSRGQTISFI